MAFWNRTRPPTDRITSEDLANYGRCQFLKEQSGLDSSRAFQLVDPLNQLVYLQTPAGREEIVAELSRHVEKGPWEAVGAWKYVRDMLDGGPDTQPLIDAGLLAVREMGVANLAIHLAPIDLPRYQEVTGEQPRHNGFYGPPVFDTEYGPTKQFYFDQVIDFVASRNPTRIASVPGVDPGELDEVARHMWDFGLLTYRGPLVISPDIASEPATVGEAVEAARGADHVMFADRLAEAVKKRNEDDLRYDSVPIAWPALGATRFIEDYLDLTAQATEGYEWLLRAGVERADARGELGVNVPPQVLTVSQRATLDALRRDAFPRDA